MGGKEISDGCEAHCDSVICTSPSSSSMGMLVSSASLPEGNEDSTLAAPDPLPHSPPGGVEAGTEQLMMLAAPATHGTSRGVLHRRACKSESCSDDRADLLSVCL